MSERIEKSDPEIYYSLAKSKFKSTLRDFNSAKDSFGIIMTVVGMDAVLVGIILSFCIIGLIEKILVSIGILSVMASVLIFLEAVLRHNVPAILDPKEIRALYEEGKEIKENVAWGLTRMAEKNENELDGIYRRLGVIRVTVGVGTIVLLIALLIHLMLAGSFVAFVGSIFHEISFLRNPL